MKREAGYKSSQTGLAYEESLAPVERLIALCIKDRRSEAELAQIRALYSQLGEEQTWQTASNNKVVQMTAHGLLEALGSQCPPRWGETHEQARVRTERFLAELDRLSLEMKRSGVTLIPIENGGIVRAIFPCRGCFASGDIDLLIEPEAIAVVERIMEAQGYTAATRRGTSIGRQEYFRQLDEGLKLWLVVQWYPLMRSWTLTVKNFRAEDLVCRSVPLAEMGSALHILTPEDNLLLCALHTSIHVYVRSPGVRLHLDTDHIVWRTSIDWSELVQRASQLRCKTRVFLALAIARGLLGTPVPDFVLESLTPVPRKRAALFRWLSRSRVFSTLQPKMGRFGAAWLEANLNDRGVVAGILEALLPPAEWMRARYGPQCSASLVRCYGRRLGDIALRWRPYAY